MLTQLMRSCTLADGRQMLLLVLNQLFLSAPDLVKVNCVELSLKTTTFVN